MPEDDHLDRNVSLSVSVEDRGLKVGASSRAVAAFDRLCGGLIDLPAAYFEGVTERVRARNKTKLRFLETDTEFHALSEVAQDAIENSVLTEVAGPQIRKLDNKNKVTLRAIEYLETSEVPISSEDPMDEDWLNYFEDYAEKASTERMRDLWARVLAGEVRKQGEFSLSTMRFLSELDKDIATIFEREASQHVFLEMFLLKEDNSSGQKLLDLSFLEEMGLLAEVGGNVNVEIPLNESGQITFTNGKTMLIVGAKSAVRTNLILITRIGREILKLLPAADERTAFRKWCEIYHRQLSAAELHLIVGQNSDGSARTQLLEKLK